MSEKNVCYVCGKPIEERCEEKKLFFCSDACIAKCWSYFHERYCSERRREQERESILAFLETIQEGDLLRKSVTDVYNSYKEFCNRTRRVVAGSNSLLKNIIKKFDIILIQKRNKLFFSDEMKDCVAL